MAGQRITLTLPGRPVPAVRMTQRSKFVDPQAQRYLVYKRAVGYYALAAKVPRPLPWEWVGISLNVYLRAIRVKGAPARLPKNAGDWDNYAKSVQDALQAAGVLANDRCVIEGHVKLHMCDTDGQQRVEVEMWPVEEA